MKDILQVLEFDKLLSLIAKDTHTSYGKKLIKNIKPQFNVNFTKEEIKKSKQMFEFLDKKGSPPLQNIDIEDEIKKAKDCALNGIQLYNILQFLKMVNALCIFFSQSDAYLKQIKESLNPCLKLSQEIEKAIDKQGKINDDASCCLLNIRDKIRKVRKEADRKLAKLLEKPILHNVVVEKTVTFRNGRYTLLVRPNFKQYLKGRIVDVSRSGMSYLVEPEIIYNENNELLRYNLEEEKEISRILLSLTNMVRMEEKKFLKDVKMIAEIDIQITKWIYSKRFSCIFPEFVTENTIKLYNAKHPMLLYREKEKTVPVDIMIDRTTVVTGPNTGGKTVFLKTVGLLTLMSYTALPIPISDGKIGEIENVFASIGDEQSIEENLSTYSAKMKRIKEICEKANRKSLILLDEISAGTDPKEGEAIAISVIKYLRQKNCFNVVTTHSYNIVKQLKNIQTAAFLFDEEKLFPTYRIEYGKIGKSYAINIASLYLPSQIIEKAKDNLGLNESDKLIEELETEKLMLNKIKSQEVETLSNLNKEMEQKKREYENIISDIKNKIKPLIKEKALSSIHRELKNINQRAKDTFKSKETQKKYTFERGDIVRIGTHKGRVIAVGRNCAVVDYKGKMINLPFSEIEKVKEIEKEERKIEIDSFKNDYALEINIIGKRKDEALIELERFVDNCILRNISTLRIVHGKGSGILKDAVREVLKNHPFIKDFRMGNPYEGGDGVTIAGLK